MSKRTTAEIVLGIIILAIGWIIGNKWQVLECTLELTFNIVDVITLIVTIIMGIYIAWILEKEVQDKRIEKDMYLAKIGVIEGILEELDNTFQNSNGQQIDYKKVVSFEHRIRTRKKSIFKYILENSHGKIHAELNKNDEQLKVYLKELRNLLTQTNASESEPKDIEITDNIADYSAERTSLILTMLNNIDNKLLEIKVLINKL
ncbi:MAG: hypothetical protein MJZ36_05370 [Bacteroidaceae bacterium]|nr:hypothetical protein [Bacteroidaceae bacterium]